MGQAFEVTLPAQAAAGADSTTEVTAIPTFESTDNAVEKVSLTPPPGGAVAFNASNYVTFTFRQLRAGAVLASPANAFAVLSTNVAGNALVAETEKDVPLAATFNPSTFQAGDVIDVVMHQTGTGVTVPAGIVVKLELE